MHIPEARCLRPPTYTWRAIFALDCCYSTATSARALTGSRLFPSCVGSTSTLRHHGRLLHEALIGPESWPPNFTFFHYFSFRVSLCAIYMASAYAKQQSRGSESYLSLRARGALFVVACYSFIWPLLAHQDCPGCFSRASTQHTLQDTTSPTRYLEWVEPESWPCVLLDIPGAFHLFRVPFCGLCASSADSYSLGHSLAR